jgi:hypothetical protein
MLLGTGGINMKILRDNLDTLLLRHARAMDRLINHLVI